MPKFLPRSLCFWPRKSEAYTCWRKDRITRSCTLLGQDFAFLSFLYMELFELGVEVIFYNESAVANNKVDSLKFPRRSSCSARTDNVFVLPLCFCFFHLSEPLVLYIGPSNSNIYTICKASLIATPSGRLILSPTLETIYEIGHWIVVVPCLMTFFDWYSGIVTSISCASFAKFSLLQIPSLRNSSRRYSGSRNCRCHSFAACTVDLTACFKRHNVSALTSGFSRYPAS